MASCVPWCMGQCQRQRPRPRQAVWVEGNMSRKSMEKHGKAAYGGFLKSWRYPFASSSRYKWAWNSIETHGNSIETLRLKYETMEKKWLCDWAISSDMFCGKNKRGKQGIDVVDPLISLTSHADSTKNGGSSFCRSCNDLTVTSLDT